MKKRIVPRPSVVEHGLGLVSRVDNHSLDVAGVLEDAVAQQEVVLAHGHALAPGVQDGAVEAVDLGGGHVALDSGTEVGRLERRLLEGEKVNERLCKRTAKLGLRQINQAST